MTNPFKQSMKNDINFHKSIINNKRKAPWTDFIGMELFEGDEIIHPSGQRGVIVFKKERAKGSDQWVVNYNDQYESRLCLQISDKGRAIKAAFPKHKPITGGFKREL